MIGRTRLPVLLVLAGLALLYLPGLVGGKTLPARDVSATQIPWRTLWTSQVRAGHLPLWDPMSNGGRPLLANPNAMAAYPGTLLFLITSPEAAAVLHIGLHHLWLLLGCYFLARRSGASRGAATVAAATVATSGPAFSCVTLLNTQAALAWAPWALATAVRPAPDPHSAHRRALTGGALLGMCVLAGEPVVAALAFAGWLVVVAATWRPLRPLTLAAAVLAAVCVAAPVLLPLLAVFGETLRGSMGVAPGSLTADTLAPRRWLELLLPHLLGAPLGDGTSGFWAAPSFPWQRYLPLVFFGSLPLFVLPYARHKRRLSPFWLLAGAGLLGAAALAWPPAVRIAQHLPLVGSVRYGIKLLFLTLLALPPLIAAGVDHMREKWSGSPRRGVRVAAAVPLLLVPLGLFPELALRPLLTKLYPASAASLATVATSELRRGVLHDCLSLALPPAVMLLTAVAPLPVALATLAANTIGGGAILAFDSAERWRQPPALAREVSRPALLAAFAATAEPRQRPQPEVLERFIAPRAALVPNYGTRWGFAYTLARGPDGLEPLAAALLAARASSLPLAERARVAASLGATAVVLPEPVPGLPARPTEGVWLLEVPGSGSLFYLARRVIPAEGMVATVQALAAESFRPGLDVVISERGGVRDLADGTVQELSGSPHHRLYAVRGRARMMLVVRQSFMTCWRARIDGRPASPIAANGAQIAVPVPAGEHFLELYVDSRPAYLGLLGPVLLLLIATVSGAAWRARRGPRYGAARSSQATPPAP